MNSNRFGMRMMLLLALSVISTAAIAQVTTNELEIREGLYYRIGADAPYSGEVLNPKEMKGAIKDGKRTGEWVSWHVNGVKSRVMRFDAEGRFTGAMEHWDLSGKLRETHEWLAGVEHGDASLFDHNGNLQRTSHYVKGEKDGKETWFYPNGDKRWETAFALGARTGTWIQYDVDGKILMKSAWADGELVNRENPRMDH